jgi:isoleucyl-tRNA synthetase
MLIVCQKLMQFCSIELGSFYLDIIKDRQYTAKADGQARRSCQTALYHIVEAMVRWMAPIMSFTAQELWEAIPGERSEFVFTETWYEGIPVIENATGDSFWESILAVKTQVNSALEQARKDKVIGSSLEAEVKVYASPALKANLEQLGDELRFVLITSEASVDDIANRCAESQLSEDGTFAVLVQTAKGTKCTRCWHIKEDVGSDLKHPELCTRCIENVDGEGETRRYA